MFAEPGYMLICTWDWWDGGGGCVASGDTGGAVFIQTPPALLGLPVVDSRENAANASGKFGGVAGVLHGVINCCKIILPNQTIKVRLN